MNDIQMISIEMLIALVLIVIILIAMKLFNCNRTNYDERQMIVRGKAYKYGFWAMLFANCLVMVLYGNEAIAKFLGINLFFVPLEIGLLVHISYSIFKDAYFGIDSKRKKYIMIMTLLAVVNFIGAYSTIANGEMIIDGVLQGRFINVVFSALFVIIAIELIIKAAIDKKEE